MYLASSLEATTLGDVLGSLHRERAFGILELVEDRGANAGRCHQIEFRDGRISGVQSRLGAPPLGDLLEAAGLIDAACHRRIVDESRANPRVSTGHWATTLGRVAPMEIARSLRAQRATRLEALFGLVRAAIRFRVPRPNPVAVTLEPMSPLQFLCGRRRARDRAYCGARPQPFDPASDQERALAALGLSSGASRDQVRRAFRRLAARVHPDVKATASEEEQRVASAEFIELSAAYHRLVG